MAGDNSFDAMANVSEDTNIVAVTAADYSENINSKNYRVIVPGAGSANYSYDLNGNMTRMGNDSLEWDARDRLVAYISGNNRSEFVYDGLGRRVRITEKDNGAITSKKSFLWVGDAIAQERDSTGGTVSKEYFGQGVLTGGTKYFYTRDHLGSIREVVDSAGTLQARYNYDPFGTRTKVAGSGLEADFGFTGHYVHAASGLHLAKYRAYSSGLGRWISRDPLEENDGPNLFAYVGNDPVNYWDPDGTKSAVAKACLNAMAKAAAKKSGKNAGKGKPPSITPNSPSPPKPDPTPKPPKRGKNRLPDEGEPNTTVSNKPNTTVKKYGPDGKTTKEANKGHSGDNVLPIEKGNHIHDYKPNPNHPDGKPTRQPGRQPGLGEWEEFFPN